MRAKRAKILSKFADSCKICCHYTAYYVEPCRAGYSITVGVPVGPRPLSPATEDLATPPARSYQSFELLPGGNHIVAYHLPGRGTPKPETDPDFGRSARHRQLLHAKHANAPASRKSASSASRSERQRGRRPADTKILSKFASPAQDMHIKICTK